MENRFSNEDKIGRVFEEARQIGSVVGMAAMAKAENTPEAMIYLIGVTTGSLSLLARLAAGSEKAENDDQRLFAALLVVSCIEDTGDGSHNTMAFGPDRILDAMNAFEKYTGRKPDAFLNASMVQAARDVEKTGEEGIAMLDCLRKAASEARRNGTPLN